VTSQALKYDVITYTPYEGLNYTILDKTTPRGVASVSVNAKHAVHVLLSVNKT